MRSNTADIFKRSAIFIAVALVPVLVWYLFEVVMIAMGAVLVAVLLWLGAEPLTRWLRLPHGLALCISGLFIILVVGGTGYLFGAQISTEFQDVFNRAAQAQTTIMSQLQSSELGKLVLSHVKGESLPITTVVTRVFSISANFLEALVVTIIAGAYIAAQPKLYRDGLLLLFPRRMRPNMRETIEDVANALRLWALAQLIQMVLIGILSTIAVWLIGLPSPLALGVIAGITEFIPYLGPILAAIPAVLVAATKDMHAVIWTILAYVVIHQTEGNLIVPLIQQHMVYIPPALILLGIVAIGFMFGPVAIIFAAPILVVVFVLVKKLYVRDSLGEPTPIPGEE
ncbi:MAG TPA: AI-2E family transporter [Pseudolabrys sp.]|nr:AI-2E family transporter [Pseudolabrys sp.]